MPNDIRIYHTTINHSDFIKEYQPADDKITLALQLDNIQIDVALNVEEAKLVVSMMQQDIERVENNIKQENHHE